MKGYLIKVTYTEGKHIGKETLIAKDGRVVDDFNFFWTEICYKSLATAKRACQRRYEENELNRKIERENEAVRIARGKGKKEFYIYVHESYEPVEVEMID